MSEHANDVEKPKNWKNSLWTTIKGNYPFIIEVLVGILAWIWIIRSYPLEETIQRYAGY